MRLLIYFLGVILVGCDGNVSPKEAKISSHFSDHSQKSNHVDPENIVKTVSGKTPSLFTINKEENKIAYLETQTNGTLQEGLSLVLLEKINENWIQMNKYRIGENFELVRPIDDSINNISINSINYIYFGTENINSGTANNGHNANSFVYYDIQKDSLLEVMYSKWVGEATGDYSIENSSLKKHKHILSHAVSRVTSMYGEQNLDLNDIKNFHLKWQSMNSNIYDRVGSIDGADRWIDFKVLTLDKEFFFSRIEQDGAGLEIENSSEYIAAAGFVNPILVYSKDKKETYVLWIPSGWPSGGAWGIRSFEIDEIDGDIIIASNQLITLFFDLKRMKLTASEKD